MDVKLKISTRALRTIDVKGGLDNFLLTTNNSRLPIEALRVKRRIEKKRDSQAA